MCNKRTHFMRACVSQNYATCTKYESVGLRVTLNSPLSKPRVISRRSQALSFNHGSHSSGDVHTYVTLRDEGTSFQALDTGPESVSIAKLHGPRLLAWFAFAHTLVLEEP
jgi:hypothetical protein